MLIMKTNIPPPTLADATPAAICTDSVKHLLCRKEAARYLGLAAQTLSQWACYGRYNLPFYKIGRRVMYRRSDLDTFIELNVVNLKNGNRAFGAENAFDRSQVKAVRTPWSVIVNSVTSSQQRIRGDE
jgi:excisionase family DNA binding protein